jgi:hypothetical protein
MFSNHQKWIEILEHKLVFLQVFIMFYASCLWHGSCGFPCVFIGCGFTFVTCESYILVWMCCTIQDIYVLCVVCVLTTIDVGANIGAHNSQMVKPNHYLAYQCVSLNKNLEKNNKIKVSKLPWD